MKKPLIFTAAAAIGVAAGLYLALGGGETPTLPERDFAALDAMRSGDMLKLQFGMDRGSDIVFTHEDGSDLTLAAFQGEYVLLNFWATWCAPCRKEMPYFSDLKTEFEGQGLQVVTVATGRNSRPGMQRFFDEIGVDNLPLHTDANSALARDMGVVGLPVTLIMDPEGYEIARLIGDAEWAGETAKTILRKILAD